MPLHLPSLYRFVSKSRKKKFYHNIFIHLFEKPKKPWDFPTVSSPVEFATPKHMLAFLEILTHHVCFMLELGVGPACVWFWKGTLLVVGKRPKATVSRPRVVVFVLFFVLSSCFTLRTDFCCCWFYMLKFNEYLYGF